MRYKLGYENVHMSFSFKLQALINPSNLHIANLYLH